MNTKSNVVTVRFSNDQLEKLETLAQLSGISRSEVIQEMVDAQYDKIMGNPQLKEALIQMRQLQQQVGLIRSTFNLP